MQRSNRVGDAIESDISGIPVGIYGDFQLRSAFQPIYSMRGNTTAELVGFEALIRPSSESGPVDAASFLEQIIPEDRVFIESMCMALHIRSYTLLTPANKPLYLNINVANYPSVEIVESEIFYTFSQLSKHGLSKDKVAFEIHKTAVVAPFVLMRLCDMFRSNGFKFALDDFGVGHSNIERYLMLRPDIVKINRSLFIDGNRLKKVETLLASLISSFKENGARVLLEGLETDDEIASAIDMDVSMMQGYGLGRPKLLPLEFEEELTIAIRNPLPVFARMAS
jgi:EAL domain-containing protein (putative c-di-GMP-specific phosphodiesterase class I)